MKIVTILFVLLLASPVYAQLTKEDIRAIIKEEVRPIIKEENAVLEKRLKEYIDLKIETVNARIDAVEKSLNARIDATNTRIDGLDKRMDNMWRLMIGLFGLVTATIAIPQILVAYRDRGRKEMESSQQAMQSQIDQLHEKIEALQNTPS